MGGRLALARGRGQPDNRKGSSYIGPLSVTPVDWGELRLLSMSGLARVLVGFAVCEAVGVDAGFDDGAVEGEPVDDGGAKPGVGEGFGPAGEGLVGGNRDGVLLLAFGQDLKE